MANEQPPLPTPTPTPTPSSPPSSSSSPSPPPSTPPPKQPRKSRRYEPYFHFHLQDFDPKIVNFDKLGVVFQYKGDLLTICEKTPDQPENNQLGIQHAWLNPDLIGRYIKEEWSTLPKVHVGQHGIGVECIGGWWAVHSPMMQQLRSLCLAKAQEIERDKRRQERRTRKKITARQVKGVLDYQLTRVVSIFCGAMRMQEEEETRAVEKLAGEFMYLDGPPNTAQPAANSESTKLKEEEKE